MRRSAISIDGLGVLIGESIWKVNMPFWLFWACYSRIIFKISPEVGRKTVTGDFWGLIFMLLFVWNHALMGKLVSASFLGFILNITRHCTSGTGSKCREETADRFSGAAFFPAMKTAVGPSDPPDCPWTSPILGWSPSAQSRMVKRLRSNSGVML